MEEVNEPLKIFKDSRWVAVIEESANGNELHVHNLKSDDHLLLNLGNLQDMIDWKDKRKGA